jgi:hypothetical protein
MNKKIYRNYDTSQFVDADNELTGVIPEIAYPQKPTWDVYYFDGEGEPLNLTGLTFRAAIDNDFDQETNVMSRSTSLMIDTSQAALGLLRVTHDMDTAKAYSVLNAAEDGVEPVFFEIVGVDSLGDEKFFDHMDINARMPIDAQGATEPPPESATLWADKTWVEAAFEKIRSAAVAVDFKTAQLNTVFTVPTGKLFISKQAFVICTAITGSGTPHSFKWLANSAALSAARQSDNAVQYDMDETELVPGRVYPAGTVIKLEVTAASTFTTHSGKAVIEGVMLNA